MLVGKPHGHRLRIRVRKVSGNAAEAPRDRWLAYEAEKALLAETACSAAEYEAGIADLTKRFSL
jgi:hypothetical protein